MKLYFDFFNDKETKYIYMNETNNFLNINFSKFNLNVHLDNNLGIDFNDVTDFFLIIEKNINGIYTLEKRISGTYNNSTNIIEYLNCNFDDTISNSASYRLYFQFNEGGIITYNGKDKPYFINLKSKCEEFNIEIYDSILINDYYEIQNIDIDIPSITFKISIEDNKRYNSYRYYYTFKNTISNKDIIPNYKTLENDSIIITEGVSANFFENDITYLHFYLKDVFDNVSYKVFKITTKQNTLTLFEILNTEINIKPTEEVNVFYNMRNVESITPVIKIVNDQNVTKEYISKKTIGTYDKLKNIISFKLSEYFEEEFDNNDLKLHFILNNNEKNKSNEMIIYIDSLKPTLDIINFNEDNYKLIITDDKTTDVIGKIQDSNFFYLGNNRQKIELKKAKHYLIIHSDNNDIQYVSFGENEKKYELLKYSKYYIIETLSETFTVYDKNKDIVSNNEYTYLNDFVNESSKNIYITFDKRKLTNYELNIIENQGGLKVKGSEFLTIVKKQEFNSFSDLYYLKIQIDESATQKFEFDIGIEDFGYSFLPKINYSNISCNLTNKKEITTDFKYCNFIAIKSNKDLEISKFTDSKIIYKTTSTTCGEITFFAISLKDEEYFSQDGEFMFFDDTLNSFPFVEIYSKPKILDSNKHEIECLNYKASEIDKNIYSFSFDIKIEDGINKNTLEFSDIVGNTSLVEFIVEKNLNKISIDIDELYNKTFDKFKISDTEYELTTNKKTINVKFVINNETLNNIKNDAFIVIKSDKTYKKQKILEEINQRVVYFELSNLTEEKETFEVYYNNDVKENIVFSVINKPSLILNVEPSFITGFNYYYLKYSTDKFSNIKLECDNKNFICTLKNNMIEVVRINNNSFLEKIKLEIIASDKYNLFPTVCKTVDGIFYNSSIIQEYSIDSLYNHKIIEQQFNLTIKSYDNEYIEYIKYYDPLEIDIFKRNKYALYDKEKDVYLIENIVTPIIPSYLDISVKIKNEDLIINKRLYEEDLISLYEEKNNLLTTYIKDDENLHISIINKEDDETVYNKLEFYNNGIIFESFENITFDKKHKVKDYYFPLDLFDGICDITIKMFNRFNKISFIATQLIDFNNIVNLECYLKDFKDFNVLTVSQLKNVELYTEIKNGNFYLNIKDIIGEKKQIEIKEGLNSIELDPSQYLFELYYKNNNYVKKIVTYNVEIIKDDFNYINYSDDYSKYLKVETIFVRKELNTIFEKLEPKILHYYNGEIVNVYEPIYHDDYVEFSIDKYIGLNKYIYSDNYLKFEMLPYTKNAEYETQKFKLLALHTDNKSLFFSPDSSSIILDSLENLYFKTQNADEMIIKSDRIRTHISKTLIDNIENILFKEFIPCTLEFYNNKVLYKTIDIKVQKDEFVRIPFFNQSTKNTADRLNIAIKSNARSILKSYSPMFIKHRHKHFLYSYVKNIAILNGNKKFLKMNIDDQERYIRSLCIEYFSNFKNNDISELKKFIKNKMEEF